MREWLNEQVQEAKNLLRTLNGVEAELVQKYKNNPLLAFIYNEDPTMFEHRLPYGGKIESHIKSACEKMPLSGAEYTYFISFTYYVALLEQLGSKVQYIKVKHPKLPITFMGSQVGEFKIFPDRNLQENELVAIKTRVDNG